MRWSGSSVPDETVRPGNLEIGLVASLRARRVLAQRQAQSPCLKDVGLAERALRLFSRLERVAISLRQDRENRRNCRDRSRNDRQAPATGQLRLLRNIAKNFQSRRGRAIFRP